MEKLGTVIAKFFNFACAKDNNKINPEFHTLLLDSGVAYVICRQMNEIFYNLYNRRRCDGDHMPRNLSAIGLNI